MSLDDLKTEQRFLVAWGRDRREIEAYLYAGNEIVAEYELSLSQPYGALIECTAQGGFAAKAQGGRLASGSVGSKEPLSREEAERSLTERLGGRLVSFLGQDIARPGTLSRPSSLADGPDLSL